ncbi:helix-turn-helix transcriptional regulator [Natrialba asiatica]|uniref:HTH iclR-type domain-containing protein n=1 Tax=Natrialba asiatica (strain ATCC 700177 / DSM 12278 / JCM 9576 / FERM P-10747 / NBRC 102637 / 172P1) TaxID=29540 RepID=M0AXZ3_NATA1|nr:hypothetical protein [Natrialba asiatica]ELZ02848.1 hypothetical protein C481_06577 [Natrialba asiatica DSM 12278]
MNRPVSVGFVVIIVLSVISVSGGLAMTGLPAGPVGTGTASDTTATPQFGGSDYQSQSQSQSQIQNQNQNQNQITGSTATTAQSQQYQFDSRNFDDTTFEVTVHENGSATWTFRYEQELEESSDAENGTGNENESGTATRENFETFADEFESEETEFYQRFVNLSNSLVRTGTTVTDREMDASNFERRAFVRDQLNPMGVVELSFTWHGFAAADDGTLVVGDVFQGMNIMEDQSLVIRSDDGLTVQEAEPEPEYVVNGSPSTGTSVRWSGEREFYPGQPRVVFDQEGSGGGAGTSNTGFLESVFEDGTDSLATPLVVLVLALVLTLAVGFGLGLASVRYRSRGDRLAGVIPFIGRDNATNSPSTVDSESESQSRSHANTATRSESPAAGEQNSERRSAGSVGATEPETEADPNAAPMALSEEELLTDEDRVVKLIQENGGRMKQVNIVDETGWSKSKVSMLLSEMEDDGTISKLRVGRENIISLDGFEPEATKSPFEE